MAYSGQLSITLSVLDAAARQCGPQPVIQGYSPTLEDRKRYTLAATDWTQITLPTGTQLLLIYLGDATLLRLDWEDGVDGTAGIPLTGANSNGLPLVLPVYAAGSVWLYNGESSTQDVQCYFY